MQTSEVHRLPIGIGSRVAFVLISAALLSAGFVLLDITRLNFVYSLAFAAVLAAVWFATHRREPLMSDATRKITKLDVRHRGEQVTIKMVGTPKYRRFSARESVAARAPAVVIPVAFLLFPEYLSGLMNFATDQVWPILGLMLWISFMSLHVLLRAPARSLPVLTESEMSRH